MRLKYLGLGIAVASLFAAPEARAASPAVAAAETIVNINAAFMHTQYHENYPASSNGTPSGDDESGYSPGFGVGASALLPVTRDPVGPDLYTSFAYDFSAGDIHYGGHYLLSGLPATATDNAVFNRIEARLGIGFPLIYGAESIPFVAAGYQAWNRNINKKYNIGTDEFYHSGLAGGGWKLDVPFGQKFTASVTGEALAMIGGGIAAFGENLGNFGPTLQEKVTFGVDYDVQGRFHLLGTLYWQHFNYAGTRPRTYPGYYVFEPLSLTTQFGGSIGVGYSF
jgi:hypothetical protein